MTQTETKLRTNTGHKLSTLRTCALIAERVRDAYTQQGYALMASGAEAVRQRIQDAIDAASYVEPEPSLQPDFLKVKTLRCQNGWSKMSDVAQMRMSLGLEEAMNQPNDTPLTDALIAARWDKAVGRSTSDVIREVDEHAKRLERALRMQNEALRLFASGSNWGFRKAWLVNGAPDRERGIVEAQAIVREQIQADAALRAFEELSHER